MSKRKVDEPSSSQGSDLVSSYLKDTGLQSLNVIDPAVQSKDKVPKVNMTMIPEASTLPIPPPKVITDDFSGKTKLEGFPAASFLHGFHKSHIVHPTRGSPSYYFPSCHMMDHIVHCINSTLCDNYHFKRSTPDYHPYILRLYFGVLFWIQCLRAGQDVNALSGKQHHFLSQFLDNHPLESLAMPGPLLPLFKTLCSSQPEFPHFGKVYPRIPDQPGPPARSSFMRTSPEHHFLPNVPGIFALLEHLNSVINADPPVFPKKGKHDPIKDAAVTFGHKAFAAQANRTNADKWSLVSPGLQYPCEADQKLNEAFAERYSSFGFRATDAADDLRKLPAFLNMKESMSWFTRVKEVANSAAAAFEGSGTLADCSPHGLVSNQVIVCLSTPAVLPPAPAQVADPRSLYKFSYKLKSTAHNLPPLAEAAAAYSHTHIRMFPTHPFLGLFGQKGPAYGPFWEIRPIGSGLTDESTSETIQPLIRRSLKSKASN